MHRVFVRIVAPMLLLAACVPPETGVPDETAADEPHESHRATFRVRGQLQELPYEIVDGMAVFDGDMVLGDADEIASSSGSGFRASGTGEAGATWQDGVVPFTFDGIGADEQAVIQRAMDAWTRASSIRFVPWVGQPDYVIFEDDGGDMDLPCHSRVGRQGGGQIVHLDRESCGFGASLHEIGHALGLLHEQARSDRSDHIDIHFSDIREDNHDSFEVEVDGIDIGPFAWDSLMLYRSLKYSEIGRPSMTRKHAWTTREVGGGWLPLRLNEALGLDEVAFADFDADGVDEAWRRDGTEFATVSLRAAAAGPTACDPGVPPMAAAWKPLVDAAPATEWVVADDFDADGVDDLLGSTDGQWSLAIGGPSMTWDKKLESSAAFESLGFADFTGDGRTDILIADGTAWQLVDASLPTWAPVPFGSHNESGKGLRFGFFASMPMVPNDATKADAFRTDGTTWFVAFDGVGAWTQINGSGQPLEELRFADIDGDGDTDVISAWADVLRVTDGGQGEWVDKGDNWPLGSMLRVANVDDDGIDDIIADGIFDGQRSCIDDGSAYAVRRLHWGSWEFSSAGTGPWQFLNSSDVSVHNLAYGRFDDDGLVDAFYANGSTWRVSEDMTGSWSVTNFSAFGADQTQLGRFPTMVQSNDSLKSDVFVVANGIWFAYRDGGSEFDVLNVDAASVDDLALVDLDGDELTDVFKADGFAWWVNDDAISNGWTFLRASQIPSEHLAFGYFPSVDLQANDPDKADAFWTNGINWLVSYDGTGEPVELNLSGYTIGDLSFCDFDGNGLTDVFRADGSSWWISWDGTSEWEWLNGSSVTDPIVADVDGDGLCDVVTSFDCLNC